MDRKENGKGRKNKRMRKREEERERIRQERWRLSPWGGLGHVGTGPCPECTFRRLTCPLKGS